MSDGRNLQVAGSRVLLAWLLAMAVGLGGMTLAERAFVRMGDPPARLVVGAVARTPSAGTFEGRGYAESDRTPIPVAIRRDRRARRGCPSGDRVPIPVMEACRSDRRASSAIIDGWRQPSDGLAR